MKKIIFITSLFVASTFAAFSQDLEWGVKAGLNVSQVRSISSEGPVDDRHAGFYAGVLAEYRFSNPFSLQGELLYSKIRERTTAVGGDNYYYSTWDYIVLPIMGKLYPFKNLSLELGPQFGYMLSDEIHLYGDLKRRKFDLSIGAGAAYKIAGRVEVSFRYNRGLIELAKGVDEYNTTFRLGVGYRF